MIATATLSESAVATLRLRVRGHKLPVNPQRLPAYEELAAAGIMEPDGPEYRFTAEGWANRDELLAEAEERIERERYEPPDGELSERARALLRACVADGIPLGGESNRLAFRELVAARVMVAGGSFIHGDECVFGWTYWGHRMRFELAERGCAAGENG